MKALLLFHSGAATREWAQSSGERVMSAEPVLEALASIRSPDTASLGDQIYLSLRHALLAGRFAPGTRMIETVISEQLGVSRTPVREALSRLTVEGWLEARRNKGVVVAGIQPKEIKERFELRAVLEGFGAREAVIRITNDEITRLEAICYAAEEALDDDQGAEFARLDGDLHEGLLRSTGNEILLGMWRQYLHPTRHSIFALGMRDHRRHLIAQHWQILSAMRARDPDAAEKAIRTHLSYAMNVYLEDSPDLAGG